MSWKIWHRTFNEKGEVTGAGVSTASYERKGNAIREATYRFSKLPKDRFEWIVSEENPWAVKE